MAGAKKAETAINNQYKKQEQYIYKQLGLDSKSFNEEERLTLARYINDIDMVVFDEAVHMFHPDDTEVSPLNMQDYQAQLIEQCGHIYEIALHEDPLLVFDYINAFFTNMEKLVYFADSVFKQNFVLLRRMLNQKQEYKDMVAIADLFYGEIPALIRSLKLNKLSPTSEDQVEAPASKTRGRKSKKKTV